jgi:tetratricopeptide (TPR) repeat protein
MDKILRHNILILCFVWSFLPGQPTHAGFRAGGPADREQDSAWLAGVQSRILYSLLNLQSARADSLLRDSGKFFRNSPSIIYLEGYRAFLDALIEGTQQGMENCLEGNGLRMEELKDLANGHPESYALLSTLHLQSSLLSAYQGENFRAARHFYYAYHYLKQGEQNNAGNPMNYRNRGLISLIASAVPEEYAWMLHILGIRGDLRGGMGYLQEYYSAARGAARLEALLLLRFAGYTFRTGDLASAGSPDPGNGEATTLLRYITALEDLGAGRSNAVVEQLGKYRQADGEREFPYLDLLLGEALLNRLDTAALAPLQRFAVQYKGMHYRHYVWHKISWCYALRGEQDRFEEARQEVLGLGEPYLDADLEALRETLDTIPLNLDLLKSRLLFDGGYYLQALEALGIAGVARNSVSLFSPVPGDVPRGIPLKNRKDSIEYSYRLGRVYDRMGDRDSAVRYYRQVLVSDPGTDWYFAPNSALHLGMILEESGDPENALEYYRKCLKINRSAYKKSIDYKARQGIRRVENLRKLR